VPRIVITEAAAKNLERCRGFLTDKSPVAAKRAAEAIRHQLQLLETKPEIGRPLEDLPELREIVIPFGVSGYIALYRYDVATNRVILLAFRHQKEVGYPE